MKFKGGFLLLFFLILSLPEVLAQVAVSVKTGCAPLVGVQFTAPANSTGITWDFDDGSGSNIAAPSHTFVNPKVYKVKFTATVNGSAYEEIVNISVFGSPSVSFVASDSAGCLPLKVMFTDKSTGGGGAALVKWEWTYGDGGGNTTNSGNQTWIYNLPGSFDVSLKVTDANGCRTAISRKAMISTSTRPIPVITSNPNPPAACTPPLIVSFSGSSSTSHSTTGSGLTYSWDLGNGQKSGVVSPPPVTYSTQGTYFVKLRVTDNNNCADSTTVGVSVNTPHASFKAKNAVNDTVCSAVTFISNSTPGSILFDYGDGGFSSSLTHFYSKPGTYMVRLTVGAGTCSNDTVIRIVVEDIKAKFKVTPTYGCSVPYVINYTDSSRNAVKWAWSFTNGKTFSNLKNPVNKVYKDVADTNAYKIFQERIYTDILTVTSAHGCIDTYSAKDTLHLPTARFALNKTEGCIPLSINFSDSSKSKEKIVGWKWDYGDGSPAGTSQNASHTYTTAGIYYVSLIITNAKGCVDTSYKLMIRAGTPPNPDFTLNPTSVCPHEKVTFTNLTPKPADTWHYKVGAPRAMSSCFSDANPVWSFDTTGVFDVTLTASYNGCPASVTKTGALTVKGPVARFAYAMDCASPKDAAFTGKPMQATSVDWNFGDGAVLTNSTTSQTHTYAASGDYVVTLTAYNNTTGCPADVVSRTVFIRQIKANFVTDSTSCKNANALFDASASVDVASDASAQRGYIWYFGDNTATLRQASSSATHKFKTGGYKTVKLVVNDVNGCTDTISKTLRTSSVTASFASKRDSVYRCLPLLRYHFANSSTADRKINYWAWDFGNGKSSASKDTVSQDYTAPGGFTVSLIVRDILGCADTTMHVVTATNPDPGFNVLGVVQLCAGDSVKFQASSPGMVYKWKFGDGDSSGIASPVHKYKKGSVYSVFLGVTDTLGCSATLTRSGLVSVQDIPIPSFFSPLDTLQHKCNGQFIYFKNKSAGSVVSWSISNLGAVIPADSVQASFIKPGVYSVTMNVATSYGCKADSTKKYIISGAYADFTYSKTLICRGDQVSFNVKSDSLNVSGYTWDFGDGYTATGTSPVSHGFNISPSSGAVKVVLSVIANNDKFCTYVSEHSINFQKVRADFKRNQELAKPDSVHCIHLQDTFTDQSLNADTWAWSFSDGTTFSGQNPPAHTYTSAGHYVVKLIIGNNTLGCRDTLLKGVQINPEPLLHAAGGDTCFGSSVHISASGGTSYKWFPPAGLTSDNIRNPVASPSVTTIYTVTATDTNGCAKSAPVPVIIHPIPPKSTLDTTIVIGEKVNLSMGPSYGFIYKWTPPEGLSCANCPYPVAEPHADQKYHLVITDSIGCFTVPSDFNIVVKPYTSVDVPTAFTPNDDGHNDVIYVNGWGIQKLQEFKIYNRWGQLVFSGNDLKQGWDGSFEGKPQAADTYIYTVVVETWVENKVLTKKGSFELLR